jgi:hypothetical protein
VNFAHSLFEVKSVLWQLRERLEIETEAASECQRKFSINAYNCLHLILVGFLFAHVKSDKLIERFCSKAENSLKLCRRLSRYFVLLQ